ncbi:hypothetical protein [Nocardia sp. NBC_00403]
MSRPVTAIRFETIAVEQLRTYEGNPRRGNIMVAALVTAARSELAVAAAC